MEQLLAAEAAGTPGGSDGYWRLALVLAAIGIVTLFARWRKARQPPPVFTKELLERDQDPNRYRDAADRALVELVEVGREINAQVDSKIRFLNRLVKDADERIARLEKILGEADAAQGTTPVLSVKNAQSSGSEERQTNSVSRKFRSDLQARIVSLSEEGNSFTDIAKATGLSILEIQLALKNSERRKE